MESQPYSRQHPDQTHKPEWPGELAKSQFELVVFPDIFVLDTGLV